MYTPLNHIGATFLVLFCTFLLSMNVCTHLSLGSRRLELAAFMAAERERALDRRRDSSMSCTNSKLSWSWKLSLRTLPSGVTHLVSTVPARSAVVIDVTVKLLKDEQCSQTPRPVKVLSTIFICVRKQQQLKWSQQNLPEKVCRKKLYANKGLF